MTAQPLNNMASYISYIPAKDADFAAWLANFYAIGHANKVLYGLTDAEDLAIGNANTSFSGALQTATDPSTRTPVAVASKDTARANAESVVRPIATRISINPSILDSDKVAIGVNVPTTTPTPITAPTESPTLQLHQMGPGVGKFGYAVAGQVGKSKPFGSTGVEVWRYVSTNHTANPADASYVSTYTKSPFRVSFPGSEAGKNLTLFARFVTRSGPGGEVQRGPWSEPLQTVII